MLTDTLSAIDSLLSFRAPCDVTVYLSFTLTAIGRLTWHTTGRQVDW